MKLQVKVYEDHLEGRKFDYFGYLIGTEDKRGVVVNPHDGTINMVRLDLIEVETVNFMKD